MTTRAAADEPTRDAVSNALAELIREIGIGARLPGERELAERLNVSRTALRDRLSLLEALGVLRRRSGSGTYVQALDPAGLTEALNVGIMTSNLTTESLHVVRVALERQAAREATILADPVLIAYMRKALTTIERAADDDAVDEADFGFHDALLRAAGNPALCFFADALAGVLHQSLKQRRHEMRRHAADRAVMAELHGSIYQAVLAGDPIAAMQAADHHFATFDEMLSPATD